MYPTLHENFNRKIKKENSKYKRTHKLREKD